MYIDRKDRARLKHLEEAARSNLKYIATLDPLVWARMARYAINKMAPCYHCGQHEPLCDCRYLTKAESGPISECVIEEPEAKNACDPYSAKCPGCGNQIGHSAHVNRHGKPWHKVCWHEEIKRRNHRRLATIKAKSKDTETRHAN